MFSLCIFVLLRWCELKHLYYHHYYYQSDEKSEVYNILLSSSPSSLIIPNITVLHHHNHHHHYNLRLASLSKVKSQANCLALARAERMGVSTILICPGSVVLVSVWVVVREMLPSGGSHVVNSGSDLSYWEDIQFAGILIYRSFQPLNSFNHAPQDMTAIPLICVIIYWKMTMFDILRFWRTRLAVATPGLGKGDLR